MAQRSRTIRKVQTHRSADFDDQLWPINCALLILAGFVVGIVTATSDFEDPRILYNGWARLIGVAVTVGLLLLGVVWLQGRMRRRLQLCVLISLLAHVALAMYLGQHYLTLVAQWQAEAQQRLIEDYQPVTVPDYHWQHIEEPETRDQFHQPFETEAPRPTEPEALRRAANEPEMPTDASEVEQPEIPQRQQPNPRLTRRTELSAPRRADEAAGAQITRQPWRHRPTPNQPIPEPEIAVQSRRTVAATANANVPPRRRPQTRVRVDQQQTYDDVSSARRQQVEVDMARRASGHEPLDRPPTTPSPSRPVTRPAETPRAEAAASEPIEVARRQPQIEPLRSPTMASVRRQAGEPDVVRQTSQPTPTIPHAVASAATGPRRSERAVPRRQASRTTPTRRAVEVMTPTDVASPRAEAVAAVPPARTPVDQPPAWVPRRANASTAPPPAEILQQATIVAAQPDAETVVQTATRRSTDVAQRPTASRTRRPTTVSRPQDRPQVAAAQITQAEPPTPSARSEPVSLPMARPDATAVSRSADGSLQFSEVQPPGRTLPAMTDSAQLPASVALRRPSVSQPQPGGPDATASTPSTLARSAHGANLPSTAIPTEDRPAAAPAASGATPASRVRRLASSAAVRRSGAQPPSSRETAAAGSAEMALGSSQIVAQTGQPRAAGIGRPSSTTTPTVPRLARTVDAAAPSTATSGVLEAAVAAPGAVTARANEPSMPTFNAEASAARRGAAVRPSVAQSTIGAGPTGSPGASGPIGASGSSRVTRQELTDSAMAGGGMPRPSRTLGGSAVASVSTEAPTPVAVAVPSGAAATRAPLQARVSGPRRELSGLPGSVQSQPVSGALASLTREGAPLAGAVARRASASQREPGERDVGAAETVTMKRSRVGTDLPAVAAAVDDVANIGAGGVAVAQGGLPSTLEESQSATVRRAAADVSVGQASAATATAQPGLGSAQVIAMAGRVRPRGQRVPAISPGSETPTTGRSAAAGLAMGMSGPAEAEPVVQTEAAEASSGLPETGGGMPIAAVRETGQVSVAQPDKEAGPLAAPDGGAVAVTALASRTNRDDTASAAVSAGGAGGPIRTTVPVQPSAASSEAPAPEAGPSIAAVEPTTDVSGRISAVGTPRRTAALPRGSIDNTAVETANQSGPSATTPGTAAGRRRVPQGDQPGPSVAAQVGRGPLRKTDVPGLPRGVAEPIEERPVTAVAAAEPGDAIEMVDGTGVGEPSRQEGGLPVQIAAVAGPGGLSYDLSPEVGLPSHRARPQSEIVHTMARRFLIERSGGQLAIDGRIRQQPTEAFRQRDQRRRAEAAQASGGSEGTEKAVEMGLDFFARHQFPDGHWSLHDLPEGVQHEDAALGQMESDSAATGLALLTYLGAGYTHLDDKHRAIVNRGVDWLVRNQKANGDLFTGGAEYAWFYSHGIAAIAVCEAYGMTRDPKLREPARKAIDFIIQTQHPTRGGWRYYLRDGVSIETDTSVTGWQLMALKSAQMGGLKISDGVLDRIDRWLDGAGTASRDGRYAYNPYAGDTAEQIAGRRPSLAMTSEAMLMRMYLGHGSDDRQRIAGADYLKDNLPEVGTEEKPLRDCYYWYYATQAMFQLQGEYWTAWNDRLRPLLTGSQVQLGPLAGSWHPRRPVADRWGHAGGRHYVTAMHLLMLEVYYRHLPLFQELSK